MNPDDPHAVYAAANLHASHRHFGDDVVAGRDWMPGARACDYVASTEKALAVALAELAEVRATLATLAAEADVNLNNEYYDRQLIAEHLVDRLTVLSGGGK